ncbi:alpha/beta fold hydrolase [Nocardia sp. NPDC004711]
MSRDDSRMPESMVLADGRNLSWYEHGDRSGSPCVFLPGSATSGHAGVALDAVATAGGIRMISVDRPGLGHSDPAPRRRLIDWAGDVEQLVDHLALERFGLLGHSAGGAYALAVASRFPDRVTCTVVGAGSPPYSEDWTRAEGVVSRMSRFYNGMAVHTPRLYGALSALSAPRSAEAVDRLMALVARGSSPDAEFARKYPDQTRAAMEALGDGYRQGSAGPTDDLAMLCRPWGFDLGEVTGPVEWWHGEQDTTVSPRSGREITSRLPHATTHFVDGGHYAMFANATQAMIPLHQSGR